VTEPNKPDLPSFIPVEIQSARAQAEARKFEAEAEKALAEAEAARADKHKQEVEIEFGLLQTEQEKIRLERERYARSKELASNEFHHLYLYTDEVNSKSVNACMSQLADWNRLSPGCDIEIQFTSPGGSIISGMALYDFIQQIRDSGHRVITSTIGYAASMAGILLQAGDDRVMGKEAWVLIHQASFGAVGSFGDVEDTYEWVKRIQGRIVDIFATRSNLSKREIEKNWARKDWWLDSDECLKYGLVDKVR